MILKSDTYRYTSICMPFTLSLRTRILYVCAVAEKGAIVKQSNIPYDINRVLYSMLNPR